MLKHIESPNEIINSTKTEKMGGDTERQIWHGMIDF